MKQIDKWIDKHVISEQYKSEYEDISKLRNRMAHIESPLIFGHAEISIISKLTKHINSMFSV